jgi:hypothetical protein
MGPLFAIPFWLIVASSVALVFFLGAVFFLPAKKALQLALLMTVSGGAGFLIMGLALSPFFGGRTIHSGSILAMYFGALTAGFAIFAWYAAWRFVRAHRV